MKNTIFYFSGTGNSLNVARVISEKLGDTEIIPISKAIKQEVIEVESEMVGLMFPLYLMGLPKIVFEFIKKLKFKNVDYIYAVVTRGGSGGCAMHQIKKILKGKSKKLNAGFYLTLFSNFIAFYELPSDKEREEILKDADDTLNDIIASLKEKESKMEPERLILLKKLLNKGLRKVVNKRDKKFSIDDNCNGCGTCEKVCSVENIKIVNEKPEWQHKCQLCLACLHLCPQEAIQNGKKTIGRQRYRHPNTNVRDFVLRE